MPQGTPSAIKIDPRDNAAVALRDLAAGSDVDANGDSYRLTEAVAAKHKFACNDLAEGDAVRLYGVLVGKTTKPVARGAALTTDNLVHQSENFSAQENRTAWEPPEVSRWKERTFLGYHRSNGSVGTANTWIVIPLVFCENRNVDVMRQSLSRALGYDIASPYERFAANLVDAFNKGASNEELAGRDLAEVENAVPSGFFKNIDGIRFLTHGLGCGGTRDDAQSLCGLLAGYATHPNVAGTTVLSLGCQNAEASILQDEIARRDPSYDKPLLVFEQHRFPSEKQMLADAIRETFLGMAEANKQERAPASLDRLTVGVECGASDGFSGISANPAIGHVADALVALGGRAILSEFPELCGAEQDLIDRAVSRDVAQDFISLMRAYASRAEAVGSGFDQNPSPGNIRDGLITDAIKSAGAAKKGGTSPVVDVVDYPGWAAKPGLTLLCTPGGDMESTTAMAGAHANLILFSTGMGTPTGNAVTPVIKISSNTVTAEKHPDMIDFDAGPIIDEGRSIDAVGEDLLGLCLDVASGKTPTKAALLGQHDFLPWKRGVSL